MIALDLISDSIPSIKKSDLVGRVLSWMNEFKVAHLPILDQGELVGLMSEDDLLDCGEESMKIGELTPTISGKTYVYEEAHLLEVLHQLTQNELDIVPVLNAQQKYQGIISKGEVVKGLGELLGAHEPGGIIVLEVNQNDYVLSEIGRICESNNAKVISMWVQTLQNAQKVWVSIKLNIREVSSVVATFERFKYKIIQVFFDGDQPNSYEEHYENLIRYLNP